MQNLVKDVEKTLKSNQIKSYKNKKIYYLNSVFNHKIMRYMPS